MLQLLTSPTDSLLYIVSAVVSVQLSEPTSERGTIIAGQAFACERFVRGSGSPCHCHWPKHALGSTVTEGNDGRSGRAVSPAVPCAQGPHPRRRRRTGSATSRRKAAGPAGSAPPPPPLGLVGRRPPIPQVNAYPSAAAAPQPGSHPAVPGWKL